VEDALRVPEEGVGEDLSGSIGVLLSQTRRRQSARKASASSESLSCSQNCSNSWTWKHSSLKELAVVSRGSGLLLAGLLAVSGQV
jgi:hypothetical protein